MTVEQPLCESVIDRHDAVDARAITSLYEAEGLRWLEHPPPLDGTDPVRQAELNFREAWRLLDRGGAHADAVTAQLERWLRPAFTHEMRLTADATLGSVERFRVAMLTPLHACEHVAAAFLDAARGARGEAIGNRAAAWSKARASLAPGTEAIGFDAILSAITAVAAGSHVPGGTTEFTLASFRRKALAAFDLSPDKTVLHHLARLTIHACSRFIQKGVREDGRR